MLAHAGHDGWAHHYAPAFILAAIVATVAVALVRNLRRTLQ